MHRMVAALVVLLSLGLSTGSARAAQEGQTTPPLQPVSVTSGATAGVANQEAQPFTHYAYIPVNSDLGSIRFERVKAVEIRTSTPSAKDSSYCDQLAFREPGGSMFCSGGKEGTAIKGYEVVYSYLAQPLPSDEHGSGSFTFRVYFRPDEVAAQLREGLAFKRQDRAETAAYFTIKTEREVERHVEIDEARSHLCPGHYTDAAWVKNDSACKDEISYKTSAAPSRFVTVTVSPVASQVAREVGADLPNK
jgi:hypothetical protein